MILAASTSEATTSAAANFSSTGELDRVAMTKTESSSADEFSDELSINDTSGDIALQVPEIKQISNQKAQIFTELLELKKYEDGYQVLFFSY